MLDQRTSGSGFQATSLLFGKEMRGMVGRHNIDCVVINGFTQCRTVCQRLNRRVPFDTISELFIIAIVKPKMMHTYFTCDLLFTNRKLITQQRKFFCCRKMQNMQTGTETGSQFNCLGRGSIAGFLATDLTMEGDIQVVTVQAV